MDTVKNKKSGIDMLSWQYRSLIAQLSQIQLHAESGDCPCILKDLEPPEFCLAKHNLDASTFAAETAAMDEPNRKLLATLASEAMEMHERIKDFMCHKADLPDLVPWARGWRKKLEVLYYRASCKLAAYKKAKLHDAEQLFDPARISVAGKCVDDNCNFKVSHVDKITMPAASIKALPQSIKDVLAALDKHEIAASDMTFAFGTTGLVKYDLRFRIMDGDALICSHDPHTFEENPKFPQEMQPRDRTRAATQLQVLNIAKNLNPDLLLVDFRSTDKGSPIIYRDMVVESGNGRVMALKLAADQVKPKLEEYRAALKAIAPAYALDPADADKYRVPILVRERLTEVNNRKSFVDDCNARSTLAMSAIEQAKRDAEKITFQMMSTLDLMEGESFDQALRASRNNQFLVAFLNALSANDRAALVDAKGIVNSEGVRRAILATFVATFKGEVGLRLAQAQFEELDNDVKVALAGIAGSLGFLAQAENLALSNAREPGLSIGEDLAIAVRKWGEIKRITDYTVDKYLAQQQLDVRELTPFQERLLKVLSSNARSSKRIAGILTAYAQLVIDSPPPGQASFMAGVRATKEQLFESAVKSILQTVEAERAEREARKVSKEMAKVADLFDVARLAAVKTIPKEQMGFDFTKLTPIYQATPTPVKLPPVNVPMRPSTGKCEIVVPEEGGSAYACPPCTYDPNKKFKPYPYQQEAIEWLKGRERALLADEMGLGKTVEAITWAGDGHLPALVIVPTSLFCNWQREIQCMWRPGDSVTMLAEGADIPRKLKDWTITTYGNLPRYLRQLKRAGFQSLIVDEAHKLQDITTQQTNNVLELIEPVQPEPSDRPIPCCVAITGTPLQNNPPNLFPLLVFLGVRRRRELTAFENHYTNVKTIQGRKVTEGYKNLNELHAELAPHMIRRFKKNVLPELPPKTHTPMFVPISNRDEYVQAERNFIKWLREKEGDAAAAKASKAEALVKLNHLRELAAVGKVDAVNDWLKPCEPDGSGKVIVLSSFLKPLSALAARKGVPVLYTGQLSKGERQATVDSFQKNPDCCYFMGTTKAAGVGITLTASNRVVFLDLPWTPGAKQQAEDRAHRIGQKKPVEIVNVLAKGTIDERMLKILADKEFIVEQAVNGKTADEARNSSISNELLASYLSSPTLGEPCRYVSDHLEDKLTPEEQAAIIQGLSEPAHVYSTGTIPSAVINDELGVIPPEFQKYQVQLSLDRAKDWSNENRLQIVSPLSAQPLFSKMRHADREWLLVVCLDTNNRLVGLFEQAIGGPSEAQYSMTELTRIVLKTPATNIIVAHNHPSGNPEPSSADKNMYNLTVKKMEELGIRVLDSIVVGFSKDYSMASGNLMNVPPEQTGMRPSKEVPVETFILPRPRPTVRREPVLVGGQGNLFDVIDKIIDKLQHPNMTPEEIRTALSWRPLREFTAWAVGSGHPVQLFKIGMVEGTYQLAFRELTPTLLKHIDLHIKDVPHIRRVYTPDNEAVFEIVLPGAEKKELTFTPQEIHRQPHLQPASQAAMFDKHIKLKKVTA